MSSSLESVALDPTSTTTTEKRLSGGLSLEQWTLYTRIYIVTCVAIIIVTISVTTATHHTHIPVSFGILVPVFFAIFASLYGLTYKGREHVLEGLAFTSQELDGVFGVRDASFDISVYERRLQNDKHHLKLLDGIPRKTGHFLTWFAGLLYVFLLIEDGLETIMFGHLIAVSWAMCMGFLLEKNNFWARFVFGYGQRIRDGTLARHNILFACGSTLMGGAGVLVLFILFLQDTPDKMHQWVIQMCYVPVAVGDALGEIVGVSWGKHTFAVTGLGERNTKSWEGTLAVYLGSFIPLTILLFLHGFTPLWVPVLILLSLVAMLAEVYSPRSTDNFTIPVSCCLVVVVFTQIVDDLYYGQ